tara:strand:+ start:149 stop:526 length:378 start_codon:yes stop_codon:yes gene_type:complete
MNADADINNERAQIEIRLSGVIGEPELSWGVRQIESACRQHGVENVVWDLRTADLSQLNLTIIQGTLDNWPAVTLPEEARIAVVAAGRQEQILLQLWQEAGLHKDKRKRRILMNIEQARAWAAGE